ncbi:glycoside hydrolase family 18 [Ammonifex degensii KC4]|uniref:Glycoside hydrolase family 18 n=1 Tax=Ammonifex degensii (strain DSM 10501 / KC4) TaxID=429009 RepID=C9RAU1_AMMDK|nr:glycoside hydrolase family 18 [Ammonifex degensii KC4]
MEMTERQRRALYALVGCLALLFLGAGIGAMRKPAVPAPLYRPKVVAFYVDEPGHPTDSFPSLKAHGRLVDEISPLWYSIMPDGSLDVKVNREALRVARSYGLRVVPLINVGKNDDTFLRDPAVRDRTIANIVDVVKREGYDGINLDVQLMPVDGKNFAHDRDLLTDFVRRLRDALKPMGKTLAVSVVPHVQVSPEVSGIYDYGALAQLVDKVALMTYDRHQDSSPPGPVAPFGWVEDNIKEALNQGFRREQILLGIATYGYDWPAGRAGGFSRPTKDIMEHASRLGVPVKWSDQYQEPYYIYTAPNGKQREIWFENSYTFRQKIELMKKYRLAGIAIWRLGFEEKHFWDALKRHFPGK